MTNTHREAHIKVGIVGVGEVATMRLLPALLSVPHATLEGLVSRDPKRAELLAKQFRAKKIYSSYSDMLADAELDAVIIATPDKLHAAMSIEAAHAGKHIFVEKPMATNPEDALRMCDAARIHKVRLAVGYHLRHHDGHRKLCEAIGQGAIGTPQHIKLTWSYRAPPDDWRSSDTLARWFVLAAVGTHALDLATWFLGETGAPEINVIRESDVGMLEHTATIHLDWKTGKSATIAVSNRTILPRVIEIHGTQGHSTCADTLGAHGKGSIAVNGTPLHFLPVDPYHAELADFVDAIRFDREPFVNGTIGAHNVDLLHLIS